MTPEQVALAFRVVRHIDGLRFVPLDDAVVERPLTDEQRALYTAALSVVRQVITGEACAPRRVRKKSH